MSVLLSMLLACAIFATQVISASGPLPTLEVYIDDSSESGTINDVVATLWFNFTIYQYTLPSTKEGSVQTSSTNDLIIIDEYNCSMQNNDKAAETKIMLENDHPDGVLIEKLKLITESGIWYGINSWCLPQDYADWFATNGTEYIADYLLNVSTCSSGKAQKWFCVDNEPKDCGPYQQMFYFNTSRPNEYIADANYTDLDYLNVTEIVAQFEPCEPTMSSTNNPAPSLTMPPTHHLTLSSSTTSPTNPPTATSATNPPTATSTTAFTAAPTMPSIDSPIEDWVITSTQTADTTLPTNALTATPTMPSTDSPIDDWITTFTQTAHQTQTTVQQHKEESAKANTTYLLLILIIFSVILILWCFLLFKRMKMVKSNAAQSQDSARNDADTAVVTNNPTGLISELVPPPVPLAVLNRVQSNSVQNTAEDLNASSTKGEVREDSLRKVTEGRNENNNVERDDIAHGMNPLAEVQVNNPNAFVDAAMNDEEIIADDECGTTIA